MFIIKISNICKNCNNLLFYGEISWIFCLSFIKINHCSSIVAYIYIMITRVKTTHIAPQYCGKKSTIWFLGSLFICKISDAHRPPEGQEWNGVTRAQSWGMGRLLVYGFGPPRYGKNVHFTIWNFTILCHVIFSFLQVVWALQPNYLL